MTANEIKNAPASIRARLFEHAKRHRDDFQRVLTRYAIERLLFRLSQTDAAERYVLKGAMLFVTWPQHVFRPTGDLDLLGHGDPEPAAIGELFTRICEVQAPDDGIVFDPTTLKVEPLREADKYQGARLSLIGRLDGAAIPTLVDIGFGDHVYPAPKWETFPNLLPGLPQARILMYPPETVVAEKFEAMIRFGEANGRIKDFHDIWVTTRTFPCAVRHQASSRHRFHSCKRSYGASSVPSSSASARARMQRGNGTRTRESGSSVERYA